MITTRALFCCFAVCVLTAVALGQSPSSDQIIANQNRGPAGRLENGVLTLHLEIRTGTWHVEAEDGPPLFVQAFGEAGALPQIPGPLLRVPAGTTINVTVTNKLTNKATVFGLNSRPGDLKAGVEIAAGESQQWSFAAGAAGTYYYWARTVSETKPHLADAQLNGAYIVDPLGAVTPDRIFVLNTMIAPADVVHEDFEVVSINGKSYPYTEPLEYTEGETIRWRVINPGFSQHPMHLHGAFYKVLSFGDFESDTAYAEGERQWVVTQNLTAGHTMMLEWKPEHEGRWLFHCHFQAHISNDERVPIVSLVSQSSAPPAGRKAHEHSDGMTDGGMGGMHDMAGLVLVINVKAAPRSAARAVVAPLHKIDLVVEPSAASGKSPTFKCSVREGKKIVASEDKAMGPPIIVTRGEPTEITVLNHLDGPTSMHLHGLELDSYYDGVVGGGTETQITPAVAPGGSFAARFTPTRAGTFIYHTHAADADQLAGGIYGALIVLEPGEVFDPEHDKVMVMGTREASFFATRITLNGTEQPDPLILNRGAKYRLRLINMGADFMANFRLGSKEHPARWLALAKDGTAVPPRLATTGDATLRIDSGEVYDFEFQPDTAGEIPLQVENAVNKATLLGKIVVR